MISSAIALISVFLPWWGIYETVAGTTFLLRRWALWNPPGAGILRQLGRPSLTSATTVSQTFTVSSLIILVLTLIVASLALAGSLTFVRRYLSIGLVLAVITPIVYAIAVSYVTTNYCLLSPFCINGPIGVATLGTTMFTWGFETGFYTFILSIGILALSLFLNNSIASARTSKASITVPASQ